MTHLLRLTLFASVALLSATLTACGGDSAATGTPATGTTTGGSTSTGGSTTTTTPPVATPASPLVVACSGPLCSATTNSSYSGSGVGAWVYTNTGTTPASIDIGIDFPAGMAAKKATLVFSNGKAAAASGLPASGTLAELLPLTVNATPSVMPVTTPLADLAGAGLDDHAGMTERNRRLASSLPTLSTTTASASMDLPKIAPETVGDSKTWVELMNAPTPYATKARKICTLPSGRNVVFWVDPNAESAGLVTSANIDTLAASVCGANQGFDRMNALLGDFWGAPPASWAASMIPDSPLQSINIVIPNVSSTATWAGYFYAVNNMKKTANCTDCANSNEALLFYVNPYQIKQDVVFVTSTLLHEATHMLNFYQRVVVRGLPTHDTWLEETSAMMTEDIVSPMVQNGYSKIGLYRMPAYLNSGGAVSYVNWLSTDMEGNYGMGGAFGAYLNRRFGIALYKDLIGGCLKPETSYACVDRLITARGGNGYADEFAYFGATVFAALPAASAPPRLGYPAKTDSGYNLPAMDVSKYVVYRPSTARTLGGTYKATTHTYQLDSIAAGKSNYVRKGLSVPANTTVMLVIQ